MWATEHRIDVRQHMTRSKVMKGQREGYTLSIMHVLGIGSSLLLGWGLKFEAND